MKIEELFCDDLFSSFINHIRICDKCRKGTNDLLDVPLIGMLIPAEKKDAFKKALEQLEKEKLP
jgi:hypothetical protein